MKKRIVYIIDGLGLGGAERTTVQLAHGMMRKGHDVHVIAVPRKTFLDSSDVALRGCFDELVEYGIPVSVIPKQSRFPIRFLRVLVRVLRDIQPDIVHTQLYTADTFGTLAAWIARVPMRISTEQNINVDEGAVKTWVKTHIHRFHCDIACISTAVQRYVRDLGRSTRVLQLPIIHNAVDSDRFAHIDPLPERGDRVPILAFVGRLVPQKGHVRFLEMLRHIRAPYRLRIVGSGPLQEEIQSAIVRCGLQDVVTIEPATRDVASVYAAADLVVVPSIWEGLGIVALEAQAAARPVYASAVDGLKEIVVPQHTGVLVDMDNTILAAAELEHLLQSASLRSVYGKAGRMHVAQTYSVERMVELYERWYLSL